ncbi:MAG: P-loop NTPase [Candidatus Nanopelagicales bacterium]
MAAILEFDAAAANAVQSALGSTAIVIDDASQVVNHVRGTQDPLVVIGSSVDGAVAARVTEQVTAALPGSGVIWLRRRVDTTVVLEAIRAGASDVVGESDLPALVSAAQRILNRAISTVTAANAAANGSQPHRGTVTAIFASKGGCGKTSIATNLAALVSSEMRQRVCLLDLDLESGDVQLLMGLPQGRSITDLTNFEDSLDASSLAAAMQAHKSGAYVLAAPRRPEEAADISPKLVARVVELATTMFDQVVIDCPPYATEYVLSVLDVADHLALVCTPDAASVKNTAIALDMLRELNFDRPISLMVNHAGDKVGITTSDIAAALRTQVACEIPTSLDLPSATNGGHLLALTAPRHPITAAIRGWVSTFGPTPSAHVAAIPQQANAPTKRSLLRFKRVASST